MVMIMIPNSKYLLVIVFSGEAPQGQEEADDGIVDEEVLSSDDEQSDIDNDTTDTHNSREPPQRPQLPSVELVPDLYGLQCKCRCRCHTVCSAEQKSPEEDDYCEYMCLNFVFCDLGFW